MPFTAHFKEEIQTYTLDAYFSQNVGIWEIFPNLRLGRILEILLKLNLTLVVSWSTVIFL